LFNLPNLFTLARLVLAPFIASDILRQRYRDAIVLFFVAGVSDIIDGLLARHLKEVTPAGAYFDPIADKILLSVIYVSLGVVGAIRWWMVAVVFGRDVLILAMAAYGLSFTRVRKFPPSVWGKISTFFQIAAALMVMTARAGVAAPVKPSLFLMIAGTLISGLHYVWRGVAALKQSGVDSESL